MHHIKENLEKKHVGLVEKLVTSKQIENVGLEKLDNKLKLK